MKTTSDGTREPSRREDARRILSTLHRRFERDVEAVLSKSPRAAFDLAMFNYCNRAYAKAPLTWKFQGEFPQLTSSQRGFWNDFADTLGVRDELDAFFRRVVVGTKPLPEYEYASVIDDSVEDSLRTPSVLMFTGGLDSLAAALSLGDIVPRLYLQIDHDGYWFRGPHDMMYVVLGMAFTGARVVFTGNGGTSLVKDFETEAHAKANRGNPINVFYSEKFTRAWQEYTQGCVLTSAASYDFRSGVFRSLASDGLVEFIHSCYRDHCEEPRASWCGNCYKCFEFWHLCQATGAEAPFRLRMDPARMERYHREIKEAADGLVPDSHNCLATYYDLREHAEYDMVKETEALLTGENDTPWSSAHSDAPKPRLKASVDGDGDSNMLLLDAAQHRPVTTTSVAGGSFELISEDEEDELSSPVIAIYELRVETDLDPVANAVLFPSGQCVVQRAGRRNVEVYSSIAEAMLALTEDVGTNVVPTRVG